MLMAGLRLTGLKTVIFPVVGLAKPTDKYVLKSADGLGPPPVAVTIANTESGGRYSARLPELRQVVLLIKLNPDWDAGETPEMLRTTLYEMLSTGYKPSVNLMVVTGPLVAGGPEVEAFVTDISPVLFDKDPIVQMTLDCTSTYFKWPFDTTYLASDMNVDRPVIVNSGTASTGFIMGIKFTADRSNWFIKTIENQNIGMTFKKDFNTGDVLQFSTIPGKRYIHWNKNRGKVQDQMGILTNDSEWIQLHPGHNTFVVPKTGWVFHGSTTFTPLFWGV